MSVIYTAIFSNYDDLKRPRVITPGWRYVAFTDQDLKSDVWEIVKMDVLPEGPQRTARLAKILKWTEFKEDKSIWVDASFIINCNLDQWSKRINGPFTVIKHPERDCVYEEVTECLSQKRGDPYELMRQFVRYRDEGMPAHNGLISTGIMMRSHIPTVANFCRFWWKNLFDNSSRDQLSFAHTAWLYKDLHSEITWDYRQQEEFLHVPHLNNPKRIHRLRALGL